MRPPLILFLPFPTSSPLSPLPSTPFPLPFILLSPPFPCPFPSSSSSSHTLPLSQCGTVLFSASGRTEVHALPQLLTPSHCLCPGPSPMRLQTSPSEWGGVGLSAAMMLVLESTHQDQSPSIQTTRAQVEFCLRMGLCCRLAAGRWLSGSRAAAEGQAHCSAILRNRGPPA